MTLVRAVLLSLPFATCLGSGVALSQTAEHPRHYEARPGDAVQYRVRRQGADQPTTCWRAFVGKTGGQITVHVSCDDGFRRTVITDLSGGLVHEDAKRATYEYKPHNYQLPAEPLRVGLSWGGTYHILKNGRPHGWASKTCSVTAAAPYKLPGFSETLTAYSIECSFGRTDAKLGSIHYVIAYIGNSWPITLKAARSKAIRFRPAGKAPDA